ncbi:MAG TPA: NAD+ synthase, partial [Bacteroidales bacterium]|nr:NAD+ synthase [Bacteroidales bacterium]
MTPDILHKKIVETLRFFMKSAMKDKAVIGLSGGIDSAVVASVAVDALGPSSVTAILLPSPFSTLHSV